MRAVLFSETGIWPIRYRRVFLALKYLSYLLQLDAKRPAANALQDSIALAYQQRLCWINDLRIVLSRLHVPVILDISPGFGAKEVEMAMKCVEKSMEAWIDDEIESSSRVRDMLVGRMERDAKTGNLVKKSLDFRHYLRLASPEHRHALTKMILSGHSLAIERRRWKERGKKVVPQRWRLCRFCYAYVEDPAHAMFVCTAPALVPIRSMFMEDIEKLIPGIANQFPDALQTFRGFLARREITPLLGKLAFDVLSIFEASPMLVVNEPTHGT
ncbi:hypothetical protein B0H14DRAFT_2395940 [Mycena olivaceomarginata]|nr:hypothetical protein B0H14DRAFT_2395940 [Mycena olivaceomarginata]